MTASTGIIAALSAPLLEAVGFLEWDIHWSKNGTYLIIDFVSYAVQYHILFFYNFGKKDPSYNFDFHYITICVSYIRLDSTVFDIYLSI